MVGKLQDSLTTPAETPRLPGHRDPVWDLVRDYGPHLSGLRRASTALTPRIAGMGLSAGPAGSAARVRFGSDTAISRLESAQLTLGEGPGRGVTMMRRPVLVADLTTGPWRHRWPRFTAAALEAGVRAVFALPLHSGGIRHDGALTLYLPAAGPLSGAEWIAASDHAAAANELLTLERHGLNVTELTDEWCGTRPEDPAGSADPLPSAIEPATTDRILLVCWFGSHEWRPLRGRIGAVAAEQGLLGNDAHLLVVAVHEAVTNVVKHGGGHGQLLVWRRDGRLWCEISDHGPGLRTGALDYQAHSAWRGANIIRQACASVDVTSDATGTRLLLSYPIGPRPPR